MTMFLVVRAKAGRGTFPCAISTLTTPREVTTLQTRGLRLGGFQTQSGSFSYVATRCVRDAMCPCPRVARTKDHKLGGPQQQTCTLSQRQTTDL